MKRKLGETLLALGAVDEMQLSSALALHRQWGMPLGRAMVQQRFCTPEQVLYALSLQTGLGSVDLDDLDLDPSLAPLVPLKVARQHRVVPLRREGARVEVLVVAIAAPALLSSVDEVRTVSRKQKVLPLLATDGAIDRAIERLYGGNTAISRTLTPVAQGYAPLVARSAPVLVYGWPDLAARSMALMLSAEDIPARQVKLEELVACRSTDVVVAPLPALEQLLAAKHRVRGQLIAAVKRPAEDHARASRVGARAMLAAPVVPGLLVRAIQDCRQRLAESARLDGVARA